MVDNYTIQHVTAVEEWPTAHPRLTRLWLPAYCSRANPIEPAHGDVQDLCTRDHTHQPPRALVAHVEAHLQVNGPWPYKLSELYCEPAGTVAVEKIAAERHAKLAA